MQKKLVVVIFAFLISLGHGSENYTYEEEELDFLDEVPIFKLLSKNEYAGELIFSFTPPMDAKLHAGKCDDRYKPVLKKFAVNRSIESKENAVKLLGTTYNKKIKCTVYTKTKRGIFDEEEKTYIKPVIKGVVIYENGNPLCRVGQSNRDLPYCSKKVMG